MFYYFQSPGGFKWNLASISRGFATPEKCGCLSGNLSRPLTLRGGDPRAEVCDETEEKGSKEVNRPLNKGWKQSLMEGKAFPSLIELGLRRLARPQGEEQLSWQALRNKPPRGSGDTECADSPDKRPLARPGDQR